eukprot:5196205-Amphidinium_carterae.1
MTQNEELLRSNRNPCKPQKTEPTHSMYTSEAYSGRSRTVSNLAGPTAILAAFKEDQKSAPS